MTTYTLINCNGVLCAGRWDTDYNKPEKYRNYWPLGYDGEAIQIRHDDTRIGMEVYSFTPNGIEMPEHGGFIPFIHGGQTKPIYCEKVPVPMPRKNKKYAWVWEFGKWTKTYSCTYRTARELGCEPGIDGRY